nr:putative RNA-directed DNA polymerase [Tanacetum cinerariifolium]
MSSECNNVKLAIWNVKSEVVCATCKQCLITANHDVCVINYVNDMNSRGKKQKANVLNIAKKELKPQVKKPKKVGSNKKLASPKPSKPRSCLRWSPTGRLFELKGKIITSGESESQSNRSNGNNACTSNPPEPIIKWFLNSTSFLGRLSQFIYGASTQAEAIAIACFTQNGSIIHRRFNKTPYELINGIKPNVSFLHVFGALCYLKNDHEDIGKLGAKGDIGFFIGYSADLCAYRVYNRRTKKIMETMNVTFDKLPVMAFKQSSSKLELQSMTTGHISSGLDLEMILKMLNRRLEVDQEREMAFELLSMVKNMDNVNKFLMYQRVESSNEEQSLGKEDASKQRKISDIDADKDINLVNVQDDQAAVTTNNVVTIDKLTLAQALVEIKTSKPKTKGIVMQEPSEATTTTIIPLIKSQDKDMDTEMVIESLKKIKAEVTEELNKCLEIILDDGNDVTIDSTPLTSKSPTIVDYKIYKEGKKRLIKKQIIKGYVPE